MITIRGWIQAGTRSFGKAGLEREGALAWPRIGFKRRKTQLANRDQCRYPICPSRKGVWAIPYKLAQICRFRDVQFSMMWFLREYRMTDHGRQLALA